MDIATLNNDFAIGRDLIFKQHTTNTTLIEINTPLATAMISLEGGQVVAWHPKSQSVPVLWVSKLAEFVPGKAIRAGVPICWPWFGAHPKEVSLPGHGFARVVPWSVVSTNIDDNGVIDIKLTLSDSDRADKLRPVDWPRDVALFAHYRIGETLDIALTTENKSSHEILFTEGLHTYFYVSDVDNVRVHGLDDCEFVDLCDGNMRKEQSGPITFGGEVGQIFLNCEKITTIEDRKLARFIQIVGSGSRSIAVWNPGLTTAANIPDLGIEGWRTMVCVETANALGNAIIIKPSEYHTTSASYSVRTAP